MGHRSLLVYDEGYLKYDFGGAHSLRQERIKLARELIHGMGIPELVGVSESTAWMSNKEVFLIHSKEYVQAVKAAGRDPEPNGKYLQYGLGTMDNPIFPGMYEASALNVGGSLEGARTVMSGKTDHAFNLGGGFHHAHRSRASGFCIFNDMAITIMDLLESGVQRVLYVDVDAHHGDGVLYAFYNDPRVLTISLHEDGRYLFPGTGFVDEVGEGEGEGYCANVPLPPHTDDEAYLGAFLDIVPSLAESFNPEVLVSQLGVDTHFSDPLTHLNLTTGGHWRIATELHTLAHELCGSRWAAAGGGGYEPSAVARSWTLMFGAMAEWEVEDKIPEGWPDQYEALMGAHPRVSTLLDPEPPGDPSVAREVEKVVKEVKRSLSPYHRL